MGKQLGTREWVGLGLLVVAIAIGLSFFTYNDNRSGDNVSPGSGDETPAVAASGTRVEPTLTPTSTPTPLPGRTMKVPEGWVVSFVRGNPATGEKELGRFFDKLEVVENTQPFADYRDGNWGIVAEVNLNVEPGDYSFSFELQGKARVLAGGEQVAEFSGDGKVTKVTGRVQHRGESLNLRIEAMDLAGQPLIVRWK